MPKSSSSSNTGRGSQAGRASASGSQATAKSGARRPRSRFSPEYELLLRRLVEARKTSGVTQAQVAQKLGKAQSHVSMCESREREISIIDLWKWCEAIGTTLSEFTHRFEDEVRQQPKQPPNQQPE